MRAITVITAICVTMLTLLTTTKMQAQESKILAGAGIAYGSEISSLGLSAKGVYLINNQWEAAASFTYFFPKKNGGFDLKWYSFDADAHYVFSVKDDITFYGIGGINLLMASVPSFNVGGFDGGPSFNTASSTVTDFGFNLGAGARYKLSEKMQLVGEAKYTISNAFFQIGAGVLFNL